VFARLREDNRGVSAITYMLILPIFVLLIFGILEIWRVMAVKQSLYLGTYKAVRQLSGSGEDKWERNPNAWRLEAETWASSTILAELEQNFRKPSKPSADPNQNPFLPPGYALNVQVAIEPGRGGEGDSGWLFTVRAELVAPGLSPMLSPGGLTLVERQVSYFAKPSSDNWNQWAELPEGQPY
jgi:hypothetical protein